LRALIVTLSVVLVTCHADIVPQKYCLLAISGFTQFHLIN